MYSISPSHPRIKQGTYLNNLKSCTSPQTMLVLSVLELCLIFKSWATYYLSMFFLIVNAYLNVLIVWHIAQHFFQHLIRFTFFLSVSDKYFQCLDGKKNVLLNPHSWIMIYQDTKFSKLSVIFSQHFEDNIHLHFSLSAVAEKNFLWV